MTKRALGIVLALLLLALATPTLAQGRMWVLVNGVLRFVGFAQASGLSLGVGAPIKTGNALYINNLAGPALVIKAGTGSNTRMPIYMQDSGGTYRASLTSGGAFYTQAWFLADGGLTSTVNADGSIATFVQTTLPSDASTFMIGGVSDVAGPTYVSKSLPSSGSAHFLGLDRSANSTFQIGELGQLQWGTTTVSAFDTSLTRAGAGELTYGAATFSALGTPANGTLAYCSDCTIANPCAGSGNGAFAKRLNGVWVCN